jgi:hypothetical protein
MSDLSRVQIQDRPRRPLAVSARGLHATPVQFGGGGVGAQARQLAVDQRPDQPGEVVRRLSAASLQSTGQLECGRTRQRPRVSREPPLVNWGL